MIFLRMNDNKHSQTECADSRCQSCEIPVVFRIKKDGEYFKPDVKKGDKLELGGLFAEKFSTRPSFTAYTYQVL